MVIDGGKCHREHEIRTEDKCWLVVFRDPSVMLVWWGQK